MSRLVAMVCNDPDRLRCALEPMQSVLVAQPDLASPRGFDAWGIGLYQGGEVLLKRRPQPTLGPIDFFPVATDLRTDTFIAHARTATVGDNRNENTHPFRYRSWLFAHHGTLPGFGPAYGSPDPARPSTQQQALTEALLAEIPDFLRRNLRGQTDSELLFHLFLARLHQSGHLDVPEVRLVDAQAALQRTMSRLHEILRERNIEPASSFGVLTIANGRFLLAATRGTPLYLSRTDGIKDCPVCREHDGGRVRPIDHDHLRAVLLVADLPTPPGAPFRPIADGTIVAVARDLTVTETALT